MNTSGLRGRGRQYWGDPSSNAWGAPCDSKHLAIICRASIFCELFTVCNFVQGRADMRGPKIRKKFLIYVGFSSNVSPVKFEKERTSFEERVRCPLLESLSHAYAWTWLAVWQFESFQILTTSWLLNLCNFWQFGSLNRFKS